MEMGKIALDAFVGFAVGIAGGLLGLGGAELRLPYLIGFLRLAPHAAVRINLAVSLITILAALPVRIATMPDMDLQTHLPEVTAIVFGAIVAPTSAQDRSTNCHLIVSRKSLLRSLSCLDLGC